MTAITGKTLIGATVLAGTEEPILANEAAIGQPLERAFGGGTVADVKRACTLAWTAADAFRETKPEVRAAILDACTRGTRTEGSVRHRASGRQPRPLLLGCVVSSTSRSVRSTAWRHRCSRPQ